MKNMTLILALFLVGVSGPTVYGSSSAATTSLRDAVIFVEGGVEFAVFPDGQFDFFYNERRTGFSVNAVSSNINISFNAGHSYDPYIQYDDYGAVVQIERVPVYYDYYGRITRAGNVVLNYNHQGLLSRVGGMYLQYNSFGQLAHTSGSINGYNRTYVVRPWHQYYIRPLPAVAIVFHKPYRAYYKPHRINYNQYKRYYKNYGNQHIAVSRDFYRPGTAVTEYRRGSRSDNNVSVPASPSNVRSNQNTQRTSASNIRSRSNQSNEVRSTSRSRQQAQSEVSRAQSANTSDAVNRSSTSNRGNVTAPAPRASSSQATTTTQRSPEKKVAPETRNSTSRATPSRTSVQRKATPAATSSNARTTPSRTSVQQKAAPTTRSSASSNSQSGNSRSTRGRGN